MSCVGINIPVPHHLVEPVLLVGGSDELRPDLQPFACVAIDLLFADFDADIVNQGVTDVVCPVDGNRVLRIRSIGRNGGEVYFQEDCTKEIGATGNYGTDATAKIECAVHFDWNTFDGERCVATVDVLEEGELGIGGQIEILASFGDEL